MNETYKTSNRIELAVSRPILRWHGGKWLLAKWIINHFDNHRIYVEPFGGAASVLMQKSRSYAEVYNDLDDEVVNLFKMVRDHGEELRRALELTPFSRTEFIESYSANTDPLEQARRTVIRSFMGFGSNSHNKITGFRSNANRSGTTPAHDWMNYPDAMGALIERLSGVVIENRNAADVILAYDSPHTLHYVDPPYVSDTRDKGTDYRHEMTDQDHVLLAEMLHGIEGNVVLSGYRCELYDDLYRDWERIDRNAYADGARHRVESLWLSSGSCQRQLFKN